MYNVMISPRAKKELKNISKLYKNAIAEAIDDLSENPYLGKPLSRELTNRYAYKLGVYRIIYTVNEKDKIVNVIIAGHRGTIYE